MFPPIVEDHPIAPPRQTARLKGVEADHLAVRCLPLRRRRPRLPEPRWGMLELTSPGVRRESLPIALNSHFDNDAFFLIRAAAPYQLTEPIERQQSQFHPHKEQPSQGARGRFAAIVSCLAEYRAFR